MSISWIQVGKDPEATHMKHLFIDLLYETAIKLTEDCVKASGTGHCIAFGGGLNTQKASVWLGFGKVLKEVLAKIQKIESSKSDRYQEIRAEMEKAEESDQSGEKNKRLESVLDSEVRQLVDNINTYLNTTGIVGALIVTIIVPLFTTRMIYANADNGSAACLSNSSLQAATNLSTSSPAPAAAADCTLWWGDAYASALQMTVIAMMCGAFVSAILAVSLTVAVSSAINMKMVESMDKLFFIRNQSTILMLPNILMVLSLNLIYFSIPFAIAYVQGQTAFIIGAVIFALALALFLTYLISMEGWIKKHTLPRCLAAAAEYLSIVDAFVSTKQHALGQSTHPGTHPNLCAAWDRIKAPLRSLRDAAPGTAKGMQADAILAGLPHADGSASKSARSGGQSDSDEGHRRRPPPRNVSPGAGAGEPSGCGVLPRSRAPVAPAYAGPGP
jgi:hypothetical protein